MWENQFSTKSWYTILCSFCDPEVLSIKRVTLVSFPVLWDKKVSRESRDIPLLSRNFFDKGQFLKKEGFPYENFRYCETIILRQNRDKPSYAIFLIQKFSETKGSSWDFFSVLRDKRVSRENRDIPFLSIKFFDNCFLKNEGFPYENFRYCEKINFRQNRDTPSYAIFLIQKIFETKGSS